MCQEWIIYKKNHKNDFTDAMRKSGKYTTTRECIQYLFSKLFQFVCLTPFFLIFEEFYTYVLI